MADIINDFDVRLRAAAPEFSLLPNFTQRVMMKTAYQPIKRERQQNYQLRLAGVSMILAGFLIMITQVMPVSQEIQGIKTTLELRAGQVSQQNMSWFSFQPIKLQGEIK